MSLKTPNSAARKVLFAAGFTCAFLAYALPAWAQDDISMLRDTETEEMLRSYETPLAHAAGLDPVPKVWLVAGPINAFASYGDGGENIFIFSGILLWLHNPNELIGVMAHETGHISAGHLSRGAYGMKKAMIPMLLSLVAGVAAMIAGAGEAGMAIMGIGQAYAMGQFAAFTRVQESTADQIAAKLLLATHQSPMGMYHTFQRFANEEAMSAYKIDKFAVDHPTGQDRVFDLQDMVDASPYREVQDSPEALHTFQMVQAKLGGFVLPIKEALNRYPESDTSEPARYAHAMIYLRQPNLQKALSSINGLIAEEPNNPYFYEARGQIYMSMAKPAQAIPDYQKSVNLRPQAPQLRLALATAQLALEDAALAQPALANLKAAIMVEDDDVFTWYETAQAYSLLQNEPMANLSTAEVWYNAGDMRKAVVFATRARGKLPQGSADWQRAGDIIGAAAPLAAQQRGVEEMRAFVITLAGAVGGAALAVAIILVMAQNGLMPINDRQMQVYLMTHPELAPAMMGRAQQLDDQKQAAQQAAAMRKVGQQAFFDPAVAFVTGPADAKTSLVEFYDYDCPFCRASLPAVKKFYDTHKADTRFSFIEFPIADLHGQSALLAGRASLAARRQPEHYMDFHFTLLGEEGQVTEQMIYADAAKAGMDVNKLKADMADPAIEKTLQSSIALAHKVGVDGTPTFVLNGKFHPGALDDDTLASEMKS